MPNSGPRDRSRLMAVLALLGLAGWAALTLLVGAAFAVNALDTASAWTPVEPAGEPVQPPGRALASAGLFFVWILSLTVVLPVLALGVVDIAVAHGSWPRALGFALVCIAGPVGAVLISEVGAGSEPGTSGLVAAAPGLGIVTVALLTVLAAWLLIGVRRPGQTTSTSAYAAPSANRA